MATIRAGHLDAQYAWDSVMKDSDWMFKMGVGGMINAGCMLLAVSSFYFTPVAFAFLALIAGYTLRFIRFRVKDPNIKLPLWNEWLELLMSGLTWIAIQFGLSVILVSAVSVSLMVGQHSGAIKGTSELFLPWAFGSAIAISFIWLLIDFIQPFLMANMAVEDRPAAGLAVRKVLRKFAGNPLDFITVWLLWTGLKLASVIVPAFTIIGIFMIPSTLFLAQVIGAAMVAQVWAEEGDY